MVTAGSRSMLAGSIGLLVSQIASHFPSRSDQDRFGMIVGEREFFVV